MRIAMVEDDAADRALLQAYVRRCTALSGAEVAAYESGEDFLRAYTPGAFQAVFLDCYMRGITGMETAKRIRAAKDACALVFTTSSPDFAVEGYTVQALGYLLKPIAYADFAQLAQRLGSAVPFVKLRAARSEVRLPLSQILWCRSTAHTVEVYTAERGVLCAQMRLEALAQQLAPYPQFFSCCRGYIVNMERAEGIDAGSFILPGGDRVPIRSRGLAQARQAYADYLFDRAESGL